MRISLTEYLNKPNKILLSMLLIVSVTITGCVNITSTRDSDCLYDEKNLDEYNDHISKEFGLESNLYSLNCMKSDLFRGGYIETEGKFIEGGDFELLYDWGWCSSGGSDCGWAKCFAVKGNDEIFDSVKDIICNEIISRDYRDDSTDITDEVRQNCEDGNYDITLGNKKIISIIQESSGQKDSVEKGNFDCLGGY